MVCLAQKPVQILAVIRAGFGSRYCDGGQAERRPDASNRRIHSYGLNLRLRLKSIDRPYGRGASMCSQLQSLKRAHQHPPRRARRFDNSRSDRCLWLHFWHEANFDTLVAGATHFLLIGIRNSGSRNEFGRDAIGNERQADGFKARLGGLEIIARKNSGGNRH